MKRTMTTFCIVFATLKCKVECSKDEPTGPSIKYVTIFWPICPPFLSVTLCHKTRDPSESTSHISAPRFLVGLVQKPGQKAPDTNSLSIVRRDFAKESLV